MLCHWQSVAFGCVNVAVAAKDRSTAAVVDGNFKSLPAILLNSWLVQ